MGRGGRGDGYGGWGWGGWGGAEGAQWQHPGGQVGADDERQCADGIWWITTTLILRGSQGSLLIPKIEFFIKLIFEI